MSILPSSNFNYRAVRLRVLDPKFDIKFFRQALAWRDQKPKWFTESMAVWKLSKEEDFANRLRENQVDIGVFYHSVLFAVITLEEILPTIFEVHLDCAENAEMDKLVDAVWLARQHVFTHGATLLTAWVQSINRPMLKLYQRVGFTPTNISIFRGQYKNRVIEWKQFVMK